MTDRENIAAFLGKIDTLSTGDRAVLRRAAGTMLTEADGNAFRVFYRLLPSSVSRYQESCFFAAGCLRCLYDAGSSAGQKLPQLLGNMIHSGALSDSTTHRAQVLLDISWDEDGYMLTKLCQLVKLVRSKAPGEAIDFGSLLWDLLHWNMESQFVQRDWARALFQADDENYETEKGE